MYLKALETCVDPDQMPLEACRSGFTSFSKPGCVEQSVMCLATDGSLIADAGSRVRLWPRNHTFMENNHETISTVILLPSSESFKKGCCQLQAKVCARSTG